MKHVVEYSDADKVLRIFRVDSYGQVLFTEVSLANRGPSDFSEISRLLGENILMDNPALRTVFQV